MICYSINLLSINFERDQYSLAGGGGGSVGVSNYYYAGYCTAILDKKIITKKIRI